ncbi:MAG: hypothetical protein ABSB59_09795, partial [Streptosporangiaceae bacterium]
MKPGFQCVLAHSNPGFISSWLIRDARLAVLTVPVLPRFSLGFLVSVRDQQLSGIGSLPEPGLII